MLGSLSLSCTFLQPRVGSARSRAERKKIAPPGDLYLPKRIYVATGMPLSHIFDPSIQTREYRPFDREAAVSGNGMAFIPDALCIAQQIYVGRNAATSLRTLPGPLLGGLSAAFARAVSERASERVGNERRRREIYLVRPGGHAALLTNFFLSPPTRRVARERDCSSRFALPASLNTPRYSWPSDLTLIEGQIPSTGN